MSVDFDFARYVARRRGDVEQRARDGAAYAYSGARKVQRTLAGARPVTLAIEATNRLWRSAAKSELLGTCVRVTDKQFGALYAAARRAGETLGVAPPDVYVAPAASGLRAATLGTDEDPYVVVNSGLIERLDERELLSLVGHQLGHIQNNHVVYATALYYLTNSAMSFVRWIVQPAVMTLQAWSRRAEITCDRAALVCARDLDVTFRQMLKTEIGIEQAPDLSIDAYLKQLPGTRSGIGRYAELFRSHPYLPKRVQALKLFSESSFYRRYLGDSSGAGRSTEEVDREVGQILSVF
jgi:Zn-dependent protease with chaperone function